MLAPTGRQLGGAARREELHVLDAQVGEQPRELILDDVGQRADDEQIAARRLRRLRAGSARRPATAQAGILALGERGLDAAAGIIEHPHLRREAAGQPQRRARQVELDDFRRAGADQEQQLDVGPALQQLGRRRGRVRRSRRPGPARSRSSMMAVAKRGSAKIITPAADWIRCAQVREPTTRKNASWILRCSQTMPVRPQNTSRWPRSELTGHGGVDAPAAPEAAAVRAAFPVDGSLQPALMSTAPRRRPRAGSCRRRSTRPPAGPCAA